MYMENRKSDLIGCTVLIVNKWVIGTISIGCKVNFLLCFLQAHD